MTNLISHTITPARLFLAWQASEERSRERYRYAVGEITRTVDTARLRYFSDEEFSSQNNGRALKTIVAFGYGGYPGFPVSERVYPEGVMGALMRRVPPQTRPDFGKYRSHFHLSENLKISSFDLLALTEAKLPSDGFSLVDPFEDDNASPRDAFIEIAGYRHNSGALSKQPKLGDSLQIRPEPDNPIDPGAVEICLDGERVGYFNRLQAPAALRWLETCDVTAVIERLNGTAEKPRAFAFFRIRPKKSALAA